MWFWSFDDVYQLIQPGLQHRRSGRRLPEAARRDQRDGAGAGREPAAVGGERRGRARALVALHEKEDVPQRPDPGHAAAGVQRVDQRRRLRARVAGRVDADGQRQPVVFAGRGPQAQGQAVGLVQIDERQAVGQQACRRASTSSAGTGACPARTSTGWVTKKRSCDRVIRLLPVGHRHPQLDRLSADGGLDREAVHGRVRVEGGRGLARRPGWRRGQLDGRRFGSGVHGPTHRPRPSTHRPRAVDPTGRRPRLHRNSAAAGDKRRPPSSRNAAGRFIATSLIHDATGTRVCDAVVREHGRRPPACWSPTSAWIDGSPAFFTRASSSRCSRRGQAGPSYTKALYSCTSVAPARIRCHTSSAVSMPPTEISTRRCPTRARSRRSTASDRAVSGAPEIPPRGGSPTSSGGERSGGG